MSASCDSYDEIKRKIRKLKKLEIKIRFSDVNYADNRQGLLIKPKNAELVWDEFFDLHEKCTASARYKLSRLAVMDKEEFKNIISEFFYHVYYRFYKDNGITNIHLYDPYILAQMGLPIDADSNEIKKKFRELAKKYHPDIGGDSTKFIELMENYRKLID